MIKKILLSALVLTLIIIAGGAGWLYTAVNKDVDEHFAGVCTEIPLAGSGEDVQIDRDRGLAYTSQLDRMGVAKGEEIDPGMVMRIDLALTPPKTGPALADGPELHPHGLSLFIDDTGQRHLFVINHPKDRANGKERIERFAETSPGLFSHQETYETPLITRANDMVAVGPNQFYVAQDVDRRSGQTLTDLVYYDGSEFSVVADDIQSGGGINVSADGSTLYIAETGGESIRVASINADGTITTEDNIALGTAPDNIDVAADGSLWVGAHSNTVALAMHFIAGAKAPTQILRVDLSGDEPQIEEIYLNAGGEISAGSGAATLGNQLLISSITAKKILLCDMD